MKKLREEEEKLREELRVRQERLSKSLHAWNKANREAKLAQLRNDLTESNLLNMTNDGLEGASTSY